MTTFERERAMIGNKFQLGDRVTFNGRFPGTVIRYYSTAMVEVRGERGTVRIDEADAEKYLGSSQNPIPSEPK